MEKKPYWFVMISILLISVLLIGTIDIAEAKHKSKKKDNPANEIKETKFPDSSVEVSTKEKRYIITYKESVKDEDVKILSDGNIKIKYRHKIIPAITAYLKEEDIAKLSSNPNVKSISEDREIRALLDRSVPQIGADKVQSLGIDGKDVKVCILDSGMDKTHPNLPQPILEHDFMFDDTDASDDHGHGTAMAGIVASNHATYRGVASGVSLMIVKVLNGGGVGGGSHLLAGIEWCVENGADIMSMSLDAGLPDEGQDCDNDTIAAASNAAVDQGVVVVAASGNDGFTDKIVAPACGSKVIGVGSVDPDDTHSDFSNGGSELDLVAPGRVTSTHMGGGFGSWIGTSNSAPHTAATAALLLQSSPSLTPDEVKDILYTTAKDLGETGWDALYGWGRVDAFKAVASIIPAVHDVLVDSIIVPSSAVKGTLVPVKVNVTNEGTVEETFDVTLTEVEQDTLIDTKTVTLAPFEVQTLSFDWNTSDSSLGTHTLKAVASTVPEETDTEDNVKTAIVEVKELVLPKLHIKSIDMSLGGKKRTRTIFGKAIVTVIDEQSKPVSAATVSGKWSGATSDKDSGVTSTGGKVLLKSNKVRSRRGLTFTFCVDNVEKDGFIYDYAVDAEKCDSVKV